MAGYTEISSANDGYNLGDVRGEFLRNGETWAQYLPEEERAAFLADLAAQRQGSISQQPSVPAATGNSGIWMAPSAEFAQKLGPGAVPQNSIPTLSPEQLNEEINKLDMDSINRSIYGFDRYAMGTPDEEMIGGLPTYTLNGQKYYDAAKLAENLGYDQNAIDYLRGGGQFDYSDYNPNAKGADGLNPNLTSMKFVPGLLTGSPEGDFLSKLARTPAYADHPIDITNEDQMWSIGKGYTTNVPWQFWGDNTDPGQFAYNLSRQPDKPKWYNKERLIPFIANALPMVAAGIISAGALAPAMGTLGGLVGGKTGTTLGTSMGAGMGSGFGSSAYSGLKSGVETGEWRDAVRNVGKSTAMGAATGLVTGGVQMGLDKIVDSINGTTATGAMQMKDPLTGEIINMPAPDAPLNRYGLIDVDQATQSGIYDYMAANVPGFEHFSQTPPNYFHGADVVDDMQYEMDYGIRNDKTGDVWSYEDIVPDNAYEIDYGTPEQRAYGNPPTDGPDWMNAGKKAFDFLLSAYQPDEFTGGPSGLTPQMFLTDPQLPELQLPMSGRQAVGSGQQYAGSNMADEFSQQFQAVRPVQENYGQDIMSMIQENPEMLENPMVMNMVMEQLQGGGPIRRPVMPDETMVGAGLAV